MKRLACVLSVVSLVVASGLAGAQDENSPTIKDVMQKFHKGANSPLAKLKTALKSDTPDWKSIQDASKDFVILGAALAKNDPPQGREVELQEAGRGLLRQCQGDGRRGQGGEQAGDPGGLQEGLDFVHGLPQGPQAKLTASRSERCPPRHDLMAWRDSDALRAGSSLFPPDHIRCKWPGFHRAMPGS